MSFAFQCPVCRSVRNAADHVFGRRVRCADCDNFVTVDESTVVYPDEPVPDMSDFAFADEEASNPYAVETPAKSEPAAGSDSSKDTASAGKSRSERTAWKGEPAGAAGESTRSSGIDGSGNGESGSGESGNGGSGDGGLGDGGLGDSEFEQFEMPKKGNRNNDEMDMTPMVDVTFLLLIFFMVTASFTLQQSMDLPTKTQDEPSTNFIENPEDNPEYVSVFVSPFNEYRVRTSEYEWEDAPNRHELNVRLRDALNAPSKPEKLLIMAHADCFHDKVVQAMDIGIEHKYKIQVIMTEEEF